MQDTVRQWKQAAGLSDDRSGTPAPGFAEALDRHRSGDLAAAEQGYRRVLADFPDDGWATHLLALLLLQRMAAAMPEITRLLDRFIDSTAADPAAVATMTDVLNESLQIDALIALRLRLAASEGSAAATQGRLAALSRQFQEILLQCLDLRATRAGGGEADDCSTFLHRLLSIAVRGDGSYFQGDRMATLDKSCGFRDDAKFMAAFNRHAPASADEQGRAWRLHTLTWAARQALELDGDFVECGVFEGFMSATVADYVDFHTVSKTFYLYDTFEGLSPKYSSPDDFGISKGFFDLAQKSYHKPGLYDFVRKRFAAYPNVKVIRGVVPDVLAVESPERIAYCHIDLNSPAAEVGALEVLFDRIVPGGLVVFDDYGWLPFARQKQAEDRFAAARRYSILELPTGQGLLVKR